MVGTMTHRTDEHRPIDQMGEATGGRASVLIAQVKDPYACITGWPWIDSCAVSMALEQERVPVGPRPPKCLNPLLVLAIPTLFERCCVLGESAVRSGDKRYGTLL
jgi:hypothetical protein